MTRRLHSHPVLVGLALAALLAGCSAEATKNDTDATPTVTLEILSVQTAGELVSGSLIGLTTRGLDLDGDTARLEIRSLTSGYGATLDSLDDTDGAAAAEFLVTGELIGALGLGLQPVTMILHQADRASEPFETDLMLVNDVAVFLEEAPWGTYFRNDEVILRGTGFISPHEGTLEATLVGTFRADDGSSESIAVPLPVLPVERYSRDRGLLRLTTAIGGLWPGVFSGTIQLEARFSSGSVRSSAMLDTRLTFDEPSLFAVEPLQPVLGQILAVRGGGFLGAGNETDAVTVLRLQGSITTDEGLVLGFGPEEDVLLYETGQLARWGLSLETRGYSLISSFFGMQTGNFNGTARVVTIAGVDELSSDPIDLHMRLRGVRQILVVHFLPGFFDSLRHYGLSSAAAQVQQVALQRMRALYADYAVDIRTDPPTDFLASAVASLEIGGPDPNGLGLLGYDNTPGKDIGNVRLHDTIGGANAQTQADGFPGYGGVFIDSFLFWSSHPDLPGSRPVGSPDPEPLFDEIFDPVRRQPATLEEALGTGETSRVQAVQRAITALGNMVGETAAHEFGHSLGLAQPYGAENAYHSAFPGEGCLMDAGADRPFGERAVLSGFAETHFCYDEPDYLTDILPPL